MIHLYRPKGWRHHQVRIYCSGELADRHSPDVTSVPWNATCPNCLDLLIPKQEERLNRMKMARAKHPNEVQVEKQV